MSEKPLRLLLLLSGFRASGAERQALILARHSPSFGAECALFSVLSPGTPLLKDCDSNIIATATKHGIVSGHLGGITAFSWRPYLGLIQACRKFQPNAIYTFGLRADIVARPLTRLSLKPIVLVSGIRSTGHQRGSKEVFLDRFTSRFADAWISNSFAGKQSFSEREKIPSHKIRVIPNAIYPWTPVGRTGKMRGQWGVSDKHLLVGIINRLEPTKGHSDVICAAADVIRERPNVRFLFIGDGALRPTLQQQIKEARLEQYFVFNGYTDDIRGVLGEIDIYLLASHCEGMPNALMEAMVAQKPCIATDVGDVKLMLDSGNCGIVIPPHHPKEITTAVLKLACNPEYAAELAKHAREKALNTFAADQSTRQTIEFIRSIVSGKEIK